MVVNALLEKHDYPPLPVSSPPNKSQVLDIVNTLKDPSSLEALLDVASHLLASVGMKRYMTRTKKYFQARRAVAHPAGTPQPDLWKLAPLVRELLEALAMGDETTALLPLV